MDKPAATPSAGYRALVVDDEVPLAEVVASYLRREQFDVSLAHSGADALALAREIDPDVVILDLALPGIDGVEVCRQLRTFSDAYVVMLTAAIPNWTPSWACLSVPTTMSPNLSVPVNWSRGSGPCCAGLAPSQRR